jgi:hypothetical protein
MTPPLFTPGGRSDWHQKPWPGTFGSSASRRSRTDRLTTRPPPSLPPSLPPRTCPVRFEHAPSLRARSSDTGSRSRAAPAAPASSDDSTGRGSLRRRRRRSGPSRRGRILAAAAREEAAAAAISARRAAAATDNMDKNNDIPVCVGVGGGVASYECERVRTLKKCNLRCTGCTLRRRIRVVSAAAAHAASLSLSPFRLDARSCACDFTFARFELVRSPCGRGRRWRS